MLDANQVLTLRDFALEHLPKLRDLRERNSRFGSFLAEQTLSSGWTGAWLSPLATGVERQAAQVLAQVYMHPETTIIAHWGWSNGMDPEDIEQAQQTLVLMRERQSETEANLLDEARKLSILSGVSLPRWMDEQHQPKASAKDDAAHRAKPLHADETRVTKRKLRSNCLDAPIMKAVKLAGCYVTADVFVKLRGLALNEEQPFTGMVERDSLEYTNDNNELARLKKNALGKRLRTLKKHSTSAHNDA